MFQDSLSLYKLIILHMLSRVDFPLTKAQIMDFILEREFIGFLILQQVIGELIDEGFVLAQSYRGRTHLDISTEGREVLGYFGHRVGEAMRSQIDEFLQANELKMRNESSVLSDFNKTATGDYEAHLVAKENELNLVDIRLTVPDEQAAIEICDNWREKSKDVYKYLVAELF